MMDPSAGTTLGNLFLMTSVKAGLAAIRSSQRIGVISNKSTAVVLANILVIPKYPSLGSGGKAFRSRHKILPKSKISQVFCQLLQTSIEIKRRQM